MESDRFVSSIMGMRRGMKDKVLILHFGSQYTQLIARRMAPELFSSGIPMLGICYNISSKPPSTIEWE